MHAFYIWYDYRYWSEILFGNIPIPYYDLEVKVTDLEIYVKVCVKVFKILYFLNPGMDFIYICYDFRCCSKILLGPAHDLEDKVTDLEILFKVLRLRNFMLKLCVKDFKIC